MLTAQNNDQHQSGSLGASSVSNTTAEDPQVQSPSASPSQGSGSLQVPPIQALSLDNEKNDKNINGDDASSSEEITISSQIPEQETESTLSPEAILSDVEKQLAAVGPGTTSISPSNQKNPEDLKIETSTPLDDPLQTVKADADLEKNESIPPSMTAPVESPPTVITESIPQVPPGVDNNSSSPSENPNTPQEVATTTDLGDQETPISSSPTSPVLDAASGKQATDFVYVPTNSFFDILYEEGKVPKEKAPALLEESLDSGKSLEDLLKEKNLLSDEEIVKAKAKYHKMEYVDLPSVGADPEALNLIDEVIAKRYGVLPFALDREAKQLKVAMKDPLDLSAIEFLKQKTGYEIQAFFTESEELERTIAERYSQSLSTEVTEALKTTSQYQIKREEGVELNKSGQILRDAPINRIVENILDFAMKSRASDVHIEPQIGRVRVRYRIDGILVEKLILPKSVHEAIVSRIKIMSNLKIDEKRLPQDGRFNYVSQGKEIDLRISTLPTVHGEKIVMRLLEKNISVPSLEDLGLNGAALQHLKKTIKIPHGIILITGPTGSGKTTTLYSILHMVNSMGVNIMTLEDPVEYQIPGVNQVQVNVKAGLTFDSGLRSFLRQDPNIIMVGEIRDNETADLAIQASLTGHLVFSTLHTNSAAGALPRLMDMEAEPFLISSSMLLSMGQRVVRRINPSYIEEYQPEEELIQDVKKVLGKHYELWCSQQQKDPNKMTLFRPKADRPPKEPDYKGRIAIFEVMPVTPEISKLILERASSDEIEKAAVLQGMLLMKQDGYLKALDGITTIEEVLRVAEVQ